MIKKTFLIFFLISLITNAQINFQEHIITNQGLFTTTIFGVDLDSDGDIDVLSSSIEDDTISWYENLDGMGNFGDKQIIATNTHNILSVFGSDIDNDGDVDILAASSGEDTISWYENVDGMGTFGIQQVISSNVEFALAVYAADIDGDGDNDVLSASGGDDKIAWYENVNGLGSFGAQQIITTEALFAQDVFPSDIDNDGDLDVFSASRNDDKLAWYENIDGLGNFGTQQVIDSNASFAKSIRTGDIDGDGDLDIVSCASGGSGNISWYENTNGLGDFGVEQVVVYNTVLPTSVNAVDLDGDNDTDIITGSEGNSPLVWLENTNGDGTIWIEHSIYFTGSIKIIPIDIDDDGDLDLLSSTNIFIKWFENLSVLSTSNDLIPNFYTFPNPTDGIIRFNFEMTIISVYMYDIFGKLILNLQDNSGINSIDINEFSEGNYFLKIMDEEGNVETIKILKS